MGRGAVHGGIWAGGLCGALRRRSGGVRRDAAVMIQADRDLALDARHQPGRIELFFEIYQ